MAAWWRVAEIDEHPSAFLARHGEVFAVFDARSQDSGNESYGLQVNGEQYFVKTAGDDARPEDGDPVPYLDHAGRVALLRNAIDLATSTGHPALAPFLAVIESPIGPMLVYRWVEGDLIHVPSARREDPASSYRRFAALPAHDLLAAFDQLIDLHHVLAADGWVAQDLYDGCLIYDFGARRLTVVDVDTYHRGPVVNSMGRMFGSSRFMSPEEFELGAVVDQRSTVFTLGRLVWHFGTRLTERGDDFVGTESQRRLVARATDSNRQGRPSTVTEFADAWRSDRR